MDQNTHSLTLDRALQLLFKPNENKDAEEEDDEVDDGEYLSFSEEDEDDNVNVT